MTDDEAGANFEAIAKGLGDASPEAAAVEADLKIKDEFPALINQLVTEQLGRPIQAFNRQKGEQETIGIALPTTPDNSEHLVVFDTGDMYVTQPGTVEREKYVQRFSPNTDPISYGSDERASVMQFFRQSRADKRTVLSNSSEADEPHITEKWRSALRVASELREQKQRTRLKTMKGFMEDTQNILFTKDESPPASPPPADQPPPVQQ